MAMYCAACGEPLHPTGWHAAVYSDTRSAPVLADRSRAFCNGTQIRKLKEQLELCKKELDIVLAERNQLKVALEQALKDQEGAS